MFLDTKFRAAILEYYLDHLVPEDEEDKSITKSLNGLKRPDKVEKAVKGNETFSKRILCHKPGHSLGRKTVIFRL